MKLRHAAELALVLVAACGPDMKAINDVTEKAEAAANVAEQSAITAELFASRASRAAAQAEKMSSEAQDSARRASDVYARFVAGASCPHEIADFKDSPRCMSPLSDQDWKEIFSIDSGIGRANSPD